MTSSPLNRVSLTRERSLEILPPDGNDGICLRDVNFVFDTGGVMTSRQNSTEANRGRRAPPVHKTTKTAGSHSVAQPKQVALQAVRRKNESAEETLLQSPNKDTARLSSASSKPPRLSPSPRPSSGRPTTQTQLGPSSGQPAAEKSSHPLSGRSSSRTKQPSSSILSPQVQSTREPAPKTDMSQSTKSPQLSKDVHTATDRHENVGKKSKMQDGKATPRSESDRIAPTELFMEFLTAVMEDEFETAQKLCKMILIYEPNHEDALRFQSLLAEKIQLEAEMAEEETDSDDDDSDEDSDDEEEEDDDNSEAESEDDTDGDKADDTHAKTVITHVHK